MTQKFLLFIFRSGGLAGVVGNITKVTKYPRDKFNFKMLYSISHLFQLFNFPDCRSPRWAALTKANWTGISLCKRTISGGFRLTNIVCIKCWLLDNLSVMLIRREGVGS